MGYDLHAGRDGDGVAGPDDRPEIPRDDWTRLVESDPELEVDFAARLDGDDWARLFAAHPDLASCRDDDGRPHFAPGQWEALDIPGKARLLKRGEPVGPAPDSVFWTGHPRGEDREFTYVDGRVVASDPDLASLNKLCEIAERLGARVRGDDGEVYRVAAGELECFEPARGWQPFLRYHRGRPHWASLIAREIARIKRKQVD